MTEDQIRELLRDMREEPVPTDSLARVRLAVAERGQTLSRWKLAAGLLAAACVVLGAWLFWPAASPRKPEPQMIARQAEVPILKPVQARAADPVRADSVRKLRKKAVLRVRRPAPSVQIRIENSDDPDVVILLVN